MLSGDLWQEQLYDLARNVLQSALQQVDGVANVRVQGGLVPQVNVTVDAGRLSAYGAQAR